MKSEKWDMIMPKGMHISDDGQLFVVGYGIEKVWVWFWPASVWGILCAQMQTLLKSAFSALTLSEWSCTMDGVHLEKCNGKE